MNLYLISQKKNRALDTYDSAVVCAADAEEARNMHPADGKRAFSQERLDASLYGEGVLEWEQEQDRWAPRLEDVAVMYLGRASAPVKRGVVCASFRAG